MKIIFDLYVKVAAGCCLSIRPEKVFFAAIRRRLIETKFEAFTFMDRLIDLAVLEIVFRVIEIPKWTGAELVESFLQIETRSSRIVYVINIPREKQ